MTEDDKKVMVLCSPNNIGETVGKPDNCADCGIVVWLSDSSITTLAERYPQIDFKTVEVECVCMKCGFARLQKREASGEPVKLELPSKDQIAELLTYMKKKNRTRDAN